MDKPSYLRNTRLAAWVDQIESLCKPSAVHWCDGSEEEQRSLCDQLVHSGTFIRLNPELRPNSFLARSDPSDVARVEDRTFICSRAAGGRRPDQQLDRPRRRCAPTLRGLFDGCMRGRTHVRGARSAWGRSARRISHIGVEITDSPYVVVNMRIMTRMGRAGAATLSARTASSCRACIPSALRSRRARRTCPGRATHEQIHRPFPRERAIWSFGSGYGGNALLGKKCFALRIASVMARDEGWLAEHMLILGVEVAGGREDLRRRRPSPAPAARPISPCCIPPEPSTGWKVATVGDDIAWMQARRRRPALRHQSRGRLLRRRARHQRRDQPQRHAHAARATPSSPTSR